ncbi:MAG: LolA family protein, partial [Sphingobacteriales bacterium]
ILFAQAQTKNDPEAKKVLDAVSAKFKTFKSLKGNFTLEVKDANGKTQGKKTGVVYMKGVKYRISITGQEIFCDGKNVWTLDKDAKEVQISEFDSNSGSLTPQKLFTNFYDKDFFYKLNGDKAVSGKSVKEIELTPTNKSKPFFKVLLNIDKATNMINSTQIFEKTGNRYQYALSNISTNAAIGDDMFVFDSKKFPGVEIIDLR